MTSAEIRDQEAIAEIDQIIRSSFSPTGAPRMKLRTNGARTHMGMTMNLFMVRITGNSPLHWFGRSPDPIVYPHQTRVPAPNGNCDWCSEAISQYDSGIAVNAAAWHGRCVAAAFKASALPAVALAGFSEERDPTT